MKKLSLFEVLLIAVIVGIHLYAAFSDAYNLPNFWFTRDDAYYYFKIAQNITLGLGSSFDGLNPSNGYHPLWMVVCVPIFFFARYDLILPLRILLIVIGLFNAATAVLIYRLVSSTLSRTVGILAASFWAFNIYIHNVVYALGLETPLAVFAVTLFIWKLSRFENEWRTRPVTLRQIAALAFVAVMVMFSRLDLIFLAFIGGLWIVFRGKPIRLLLPLDLVIIFFSMTASTILRTGFEEYNTLYAASTTRAVILAIIVKVVCLYFLGAYQHPRENSVWKTIRQTVLALSISTVLIAIIQRIGIGENFPRTAFIIDWVLGMILITAIRLGAIWLGNREIKINPQPAAPTAELQNNWKKWLTDGIAYYGIVGGMLGAYMLFNKIMFGTSSPVSGQIKRWWGSMSTIYDPPARSWAAYFGVDYRGSFNVWQPASDFFLWLAKILKPIYPGADTVTERYYIAIILVACLSVILFALQSRMAFQKAMKLALIPLAAGSGIQILSYTATAYGGAKEWYWVSQMIFITLFGSLLIELILRALQARLRRMAQEKIKITRPMFEFASIILAVLMAYTFGSHIYKNMPYNFYPKDKPYMDVLQFLQDNTPPGSIIGMTGGGNTGYFLQDRTIVNMDGLINSNDYFHALQNREAAQFLHQHGVQIIFANVQSLELPPYFGQFAPYLERFNVYGGKVLVYLLEEPKY